MAILDLNIILVGKELFASDSQKIRDALAVAKTILNGLGIGLGQTTFFSVPTSKAGAFTFIDSSAEAADLTHEFSTANAALNVFLVKGMKDAVGWAPVGGTCDKVSRKKMTGAVVLLTGNPAFDGNSIAHETGHYLGLPHNTLGAANFMAPQSNSFTNSTDDQTLTARGHCFIRN